MSLAYNKFKPELREGGMLIYEKDLVEPEPSVSQSLKVFHIPATKLAEELGRQIVLNIVMVGFFTAVTNIISHDAMRKSVENSVPPGTEMLNLKAFEKGYEYGKKLATSLV